MFKELIAPSVTEQVNEVMIEAIGSPSGTLTYA